MPRLARGHIAGSGVAVASTAEAESTAIASNTQLPFSGVPDDDSQKEFVVTQLAHVKFGFPL